MGKKKKKLGDLRVNFNPDYLDYYIAVSACSAFGEDDLVFEPIPASTSGYEVSYLPVTEEQLDFMCRKEGLNHN